MISKIDQIIKNTPSITIHIEYDTIYDNDNNSETNNESSPMNHNQTNKKKIVLCSNKQNVDSSLNLPKDSLSIIEMNESNKLFFLTLNFRSEIKRFRFSGCEELHMKNLCQPASKIEKNNNNWFKLKNKDSDQPNVVIDEKKPAPIVKLTNLEEDFIKFLITDDDDDNNTINTLLEHNFKLFKNGKDVKMGMGTFRDVSQLTNSVEKDDLNDNSIIINKYDNIDDNNDDNETKENTMIMNIDKEDLNTHQNTGKGNIINHNSNDGIRNVRKRKRKVLASYKITEINKNEIKSKDTILFKISTDDTPSSNHQCSNIDEQEELNEIKLQIIPLKKRDKSRISFPLINGLSTNDGILFIIPEPKIITGIVNFPMAVCLTMKLNGVNLRIDEKLKSSFCSSNCDSTIIVKFNDAVETLSTNEKNEIDLIKNNLSSLNTNQLKKKLYYYSKINTLIINQLIKKTNTFTDLDNKCIDNDVEFDDDDNENDWDFGEKKQELLPSSQKKQKVMQQKPLETQSISPSSFNGKFSNQQQNHFNCPSYIPQPQCNHQNIPTSSHQFPVNNALQSTQSYQLPQQRQQQQFIQYPYQPQQLPTQQPYQPQQQFTQTLYQQPQQQQQQQQQIPAQQLYQPPQQQNTQQPIQYQQVQNYQTRQPSSLLQSTTPHLTNSFPAFPNKSNHINGPNISDKYYIKFGRTSKVSNLVVCIPIHRFFQPNCEIKLKFTYSTRVGFEEVYTIVSSEFKDEVKKSFSNDHHMYLVFKREKFIEKLNLEKTVSINARLIINNEEKATVEKWTKTCKKDKYLTIHGGIKSLDNKCDVVVEKNLNRSDKYWWIKKDQSTLDDETNSDSIGDGCSNGDDHSLTELEEIEENKLPINPSITDDDIPIRLLPFLPKQENKSIIGNSKPSLLGNQRKLLKSLVFVTLKKKPSEEVKFSLILKRKDTDCEAVDCGKVYVKIEPDNWVSSNNGTYFYAIIDKVKYLNNSRTIDELRTINLRQRGRTYLQERYPDSNPYCIYSSPSLLFNRRMDQCLEELKYGIDSILLHRDNNEFSKEVISKLTQRFKIQ
jgi:hypothetical protein